MMSIEKTDNFDAKDTSSEPQLNGRECKTVCLALGPYRNLTTLTAATLFLHPSCQVLNHAGNRIYGNDEVDFLSHYTKGRFDRFIQFAIRISDGGKRGDYGGSIIHSHAFDAHHEMKQKFYETGEELVKSHINCLFWKESLATSNLIREKNIDLSDILKKEQRLMFLMPIRNPMDCAISNLKTGHANRFRGLKDNPTEIEVLRAILDEIHWFASYKAAFPDRFYYYFEHSISRGMLVELADFLRLDQNETWMSMAQAVMVSKSNYPHEDNFLAYYREMVKEQFVDYPVLMERLLLFA